MTLCGRQERVFRNSSRMTHELRDGFGVESFQELRRSVTLVISPLHKPPGNIFPQAISLVSSSTREFFSSRWGVRAPMDSDVYTESTPAPFMVNIEATDGGCVLSAHERLPGPLKLYQMLPVRGSL